MAFVVVGFFLVSFSFFDETRGKRVCVCEAVFIFVELLRETSVLGGGGLWGLSMLPAGLAGLHTQVSVTSSHPAWSS